MVSRVVKKPPQPQQPHRHTNTASYYAQSGQVSVTFRVQIPDIKPNECLYMVGGGKMLGDWAPERGKELVTHDGVTWSVTLERSQMQTRSEMQIQCQYVLIGEGSGNRYVRWEGGDNRSFDMNLKYSCIFNEVERSFGDLRPLQADSQEDGGCMNSVVLYRGNEETETAHDSENRSSQTWQRLWSWTGTTSEELQNLQSGLSRVEEKLQKQQERQENYVEARLCDFEARISKLEPLLADQKKLTTLMDPMERDISDLGFRVEDIIDNKNGREAEPWQDLTTAFEECLQKYRLTSDRQQTLDNRVAELEKRVSVAEGFCTRQSALEHSMVDLKSKASQTEACLCDFEARILKLEPLLADQKMLTTLMDRMERDISVLGFRIPDSASAEDVQFNLAPKIDEKLHHFQNQIKVLEGQVSFLKDAVQKRCSQDAHKLENPPTLVPTAASKAAVSEFAAEKSHPDDAPRAQRLLPVHPAGSEESSWARRPRSAAKVDHSSGIHAFQGPATSRG